MARSENKTPPDQLKRILQVAKLGLKLIPTIDKSPDKTLGASWQERASSDPKTIQQWFAKWPKANWGILIGGDTGLVCIDVDGPSHRTGNGMPIWKELTKGKKIPTVSWVSTSGDGQAYLFKKPTDVSLRSKIEDVIEVRGINGYAQQILPLTKDRYIKDFRTKISNLPKWILPYVTASKTQSDNRKESHKPLPGPVLDVESYLNFHNLEYTSREKSDGTYYTFKKCPTNDLGHDEDGTTVLIKYASGGMQYKCLHAKCDEMDWQAFNKKFSSMGFWTVPREMPREELEFQLQSRFQLHTIQEANQPQPPVDWVIDGIMSSRSTNLPYGEPGSKKTYIELVKAVCVAAGVPFLDKEVKQGPVLIIDEESGHTRLLRRLRQVVLGLGVSFDIPVQFITLAGISLGAKDLDDRTILIKIFDEVKPVFCLIDALADVTNGDENSKEYIHPVFQFLRSLAEDHGTAFDVIHHSSKAGGYRGSSAMFGAVDSQTKIISPQDDGLIIFNMEKSRDSESGMYGAKAEWLDDENGETIFKLTAAFVDPSQVQINGGKKEKKSAAKDYVLLYLMDNPNSSHDSVISNIEGCTPETAKVALHRLVQDGLVIKKELKNKKNSYKLSVKGEEVMRESEI